MSHRRVQSLARNKPWWWSSRIPSLSDCNLRRHAFTLSGFPLRNKNELYWWLLNPINKLKPQTDGHSIFGVFLFKWIHRQIDLVCLHLVSSSSGFLRLVQANSELLKLHNLTRLFSLDKMFPLGSWGLNGLNANSEHFDNRTSSFINSILFKIKWIAIKM